MTELLFNLKELHTLLKAFERVGEVFDIGYFAPYKTHYFYIFDNNKKDKDNLNHRFMIKQEGDEFVLNYVYEAKVDNNVLYVWEENERFKNNFPELTMSKDLTADQFTILILDYLLKTKEKREAMKLYAMWW